MILNPWKKIKALQGELMQAQIDHERALRGLMQVAEQCKPTSNATVRRMADIAMTYLGYARR